MGEGNDAKNMRQNKAPKHSIRFFVASEKISDPSRRTRATEQEPRPKYTCDFQVAILGIDGEVHKEAA